MNNSSDKREFERFPMEFVLEVAAEDVEGKTFNEKAVLKNISGGGAKFTTQQADKYFTGQSLEMTIYLPGTNNVKGHMKGKATVVRIDPLSDSGIGEKSRRFSVAVKFDTRLNFERLKAKKNRSEPTGVL